MPNPITSRDHCESCITSKCCCCLPLKAGAITIAILQFIDVVVWIAGGVQEGNLNASMYAGILSAILMLLSGIFILIAVRQESSKFLWFAVYINLSLGIWLIINGVVWFATGIHWYYALAAFITAFVILYFYCVLRSYAFKLESRSAPPANLE